MCTACAEALPCAPIARTTELLVVARKPTSKRFACGPIDTACVRTGFHSAGVPVPVAKVAAATTNPETQPAVAIKTRSGQAPPAHNLRILFGIPR